MNKIIQFLQINKTNFIHLYELILDFLKTILNIKQNTEELVEGGALEKVDVQDYMLGDEEGPELFKNKNPYKKIIEFNQHKGIHKSSCTLFATIGMTNYNTGLGFQQKDVEKYSKQLINEGIIVPGRGAYIRNVVDRFRKILQDEYNEDVIWYTISIHSKTFEEGLKNGWGFVIGYRTSKEKFKDTQEDGIENGCEYPRHGGHAVWVRKNENGELEVINSYKGVLRFNRYKFYEGLKQLRCEVDKGIYFPYARIIMKKEQLSQYEKDVKTIEKAIEIGITNDIKVLDDIKNKKYTWKVQTILMLMRGLEKLKNGEL